MGVIIFMANSVEKELHQLNIWLESIAKDMHAIRSHIVKPEENKQSDDMYEEFKKGVINYATLRESQQ